MPGTQLKMAIGLVSGFAAATFLVMAIRVHARRRAGADPTQSDADGKEKRDLEIIGREKLNRIGAVLRPRDKKAIDELRNRVSQAGLYSRDAVDLFLTVRVSLLLLGVLAGLALVSAVEAPPLAMFLFTTVVGLSFVAPGMWLSSRTRARQTEILRSLPGTLDLLVTCLEAGLGLEQAMARVSEQSRFSDDLLSSEIRITLAEIRAGLDLNTAFRKLAARIGLEDINTLAVVITQASALGTNIGQLLRDHSRTLRQHRLLQLEERAGKANAKLTLPLTLCLLPSVLVLLLGPAVVMMMHSL